MYKETTIVFYAVCIETHNKYIVGVSQASLGNLQQKQCDTF